MGAPPIAYEVVSERGREAVYAADLRQHAERACLLNGWRLVPIYAQQDTDTMHNLARFDAAPYGVYRWAGEVPPGVPQPDNGPAAMGRGQWPLGGAAPH